jgi:hypothetical protein
MQTMREMLKTVKVMKMEKVFIGLWMQKQISFLQHANHLKINLLDIINQCKCGKKIAGTLQEKGAKGVKCKGSNVSEVSARRGSPKHGRGLRGRRRRFGASHWRRRRSWNRKHSGTK